MTKNEKLRGNIEKKKVTNGILHYWTALGVSAKNSVCLHYSNVLRASRRITAVCVKSFM